MKRVITVLLVTFIIGMSPAFAAEVSVSGQTVDPMNVKGKGVEAEAASEILEQSGGGQATVDNGTLNTTTEATNTTTTETSITTTDPSTTTDASTTTTESSAMTETGETIEGIDNQTTVDITPELNTTGIVMQTTNYTCGPAALATVLNNMGINATEEELITLAGTDENGTTMYGLVEAANSKGLKAIGMKLSVDDLKPNYIVFITADGGPHYSVIKEITADKVLLADPSLGNIEMTLEEFKGYFSGYVLVIDELNSTSKLNNCTQTPENTEQANNITDENSIKQSDSSKNLTNEEMQNIIGKQGGWIYIWVKSWYFVFWRYIINWHWAYYGKQKYGYTFAYIYGPHWIWDPHWKYGWTRKLVYCSGTLPSNYAGRAY